MENQKSVCSPEDSAFSFFIDPVEVSRIFKKDGVTQEVVDNALRRLLNKEATNCDWQFMLVVCALMVNSIVEKEESECH